MAARAGTGARQSHRRVTLAVHIDGTHPVRQRLRSGVEHGARLAHDGRRCQGGGAEVLQLVPAGGRARGRGTGHPGGVDADAVAGPQPPLTNHGLQQAIVQPIQPLGDTRLGDVHGILGGRDRDGDVGRQRRRAARIADPAHLEQAEHGAIHADEVAGVGARVHVVDALRRERAGRIGRRHQAVKLEHHEAARQRRLPDHIRRGGIERHRVEVAATELIDADVQGVFVNAERRIVAEAARRARHPPGGAGIDPLVDEPAGRGGDDAAAADGEHVAVRRGDCEGQHEPAPGAPVIAHARVARVGAPIEHVERHIEHVVFHAGVAADGADEPVQGHDILSGADVAHRVRGRKRNVGGVGDLGVRCRFNETGEQRWTAVAGGCPRGPATRRGRIGVVLELASIRPDLDHRGAVFGTARRPKTGLCGHLCHGPDRRRGTHEGLGGHERLPLWYGAIHPGNGRRTEAKRHTFRGQAGRSDTA